MLRERIAPYIDGAITMVKDLILMCAIGLVLVGSCRVTLDYARLKLDPPASSTVVLAKGQPLEFDQLEVGYYTVIAIVDHGQRTAVIRQTVPTADIDWFVTDMPRVYFTPGGRFARPGRRA